MTCVSWSELRIFRHVSASCLLLYLMIGIARAATNSQQPGRVVTEPSVNIQRGKTVFLPCFFEFKPIAVLWNKGSLGAEDNIVYVDTFYNPGQKDGPGYVDGTVDIAANFSLIVKEVKLEDVGRYFCTCVVIHSETRSEISNHTDLTIFVPPMEPFPTITECSTSMTGQHSEQNCILLTREDSMNVTCTVNGYFPAFRLLFSHSHLDIEVLKTWEWNNTDGTYGRSLTIRAVPNPGPYICLASGIVLSGDVDESSTSIVLKKDLLEPLAPEHNRSKEIGIILALFLVSVIIPLVSFLLMVRKTKIRTRDQFLEVQLASTIRHQQRGPLSEEEEDRCKRELRYHYKQCLGQDTLILNNLPENKTWARYAAEVIVSLKNLGTLIFEECYGYSAEDFYAKLAEVSPSSNIETLVHHHGFLYTFVLSPVASRHYARSIFSMPRLRVFRLQNVKLDDTFYETMTEVSPSSKIETLVHGFHYTIVLSPVASRHYARSIFSMPWLHVLDIQNVYLDDTFYETMAEVSPSSKMEKLRIMSGHRGGSNAARKLATGISSLHHLSSLYLAITRGVLFNEMCHLITTSPSSFKMRTLILEDAVLTRWNMETLLSLDSLRSIRFIRVKAEGEDYRDPSSHRSQMKQEDTVGLSHVTALSMDDVTLPHLVELDVHKQCSRVQKVQLDFTSDVSNDVFMNLSKFSSASQLYFVAYWTEIFPFCKKIKVNDTLPLCHFLKTSWPSLVSLVIVDIMMWNSGARNILQMAEKRGSLRNITMTRCGTTDALNAYLGEMKDDVIVTLTHGIPMGMRTYDDEHEYYDQRSRQAVFDVITVDHE